MLFLLEHLVERSGTAVVQQGVAQAHAPQRRRVELMIAHFVRQPDIVTLG